MLKKPVFWAALIVVGAVITISAIAYSFSWGKDNAIRENEAQLRPVSTNITTTPKLNALGVPTRGVTVTGEAQLHSDADNDGLKDWEETLWGTDFTRADTDGDGTSDGEEVDAQRNPLKKSPGDTFTSSEIISLANTQNQVTQLIKAQEKVAATLPKSSTTSTAPSTTSPQDPLRTYGNLLATILTNGAATVKDQATIIDTAIRQKNLNEIRKLEGFDQKYLDLGAATGQLSAPTTLIGLQHDITKALEASAASLSTIITTTNKALQTYPQQSAETVLTKDFFSTYTAASTAYANAFRAYMQFFKEKGIEFGQNEPGVIFTPHF